MPQFSDDLFLGSATTEMGMTIPGDPSPMSQGVGPLGRIYVWDSVPATKGNANIAAASVWTSSITLTAGTGVTATTNAAGTSVLQLDVPRVVTVTTGAGTPTTRNVTISGFDIYGQPMSEVIATGAVASTTTAGKKAFHQISSATISGSPVVTVSVGTGDVFGSPVRFTDRGYIARVGWDNALAEDAATVAVADTATATTTTGDVRGTVAPSSAANGTRRLVVGILLTAIATGPTATRAGALGVTQA
jgi:hypothetical protein